MKHSIFRSLAATALFATSASAATYTINLTGSTAFRASTHSAIVANLSSPTFAWVDPDGSTPRDKSKYTIFKGGSGSDTLIVRCYWSGSVDGIIDVGAQVALNKYLPTTTTTTASPGTNLGNITPTDPGIPDGAMSDVFQSSTSVTATLTDTQVAVVPFVFIANKGSTITNMTPQAYRAIYGAGVGVKSLFTGLDADKDKYVYGVGRDSGSGTRATAMAETGYGIFKAVQQYTPTVSGGAITALTAVADPAGYSSGGTLASDLANTSNENDPNVGIVVGYVGIADANANNVQLTYNGVAYSASNVYNGYYTFWGYEHLFTPSRVSGASSGSDLIAKNFFTAMGTSLAANPGSAGLNPALMKVSRAGDGGDVNRNGNP